MQPSNYEEKKFDVTLIPLCDQAIITLLRNFKDMLITGIGPDGCLKLLVSGGGYINLASSSSILLQHYDQFSSPITQFIAQVIKGQSDCGLFTGILISSIMENVLTLRLNNRMNSKQNVYLLNFIFKNINSILNNDNLKIKVCFNSVSDFLPIVETILKSKYNNVLMRNSITELSLQIIKAFLFTLDENKMVLGNINVEVYKGCEKFKFYPGIIYQLVDTDMWIFDLISKSNFKDKKQKFKTLLFTTKLDNDDKFYENNNDNVLNDKLPFIIDLLKNAVSFGVKIIACQKTVNDNIKLFFKRQSVIIIERMGTELAVNFEHLTGSFPISSVNQLSLSNLSEMIGSVDNLSTINIGENNYVMFENQSTSATTLILQYPSLVATDQIKVLVKQTLNVLRSVAVNQHVIPGAGCYELQILLHFLNLDENKIMGENWRWLLKSLLESTNHTLPVFTDTIYGHAWSTEDKLFCNCNLVSKDMVFQNNGSWIILPPDQMDDILKSIDFSNSIRNDDLMLNTSAIVESFGLKKNAIAVSLDSCINLLSIGTFMYVNTS